MRQRAYAKSNPVLIRSGGPSDSTRFIRKKNSVTKGRKEGRNLRGYGCHISVTAGRLVLKGSKKSQNQSGFLCFPFCFIQGRCVKNFSSIGFYLLWKNYHELRTVRYLVFWLVFLILYLSISFLVCIKNIKHI